MEFEQLRKRQFSIIETGFGSGLNFFNVATAWRNFQAVRKPDHLTKLNYTSIEGFPLRHEDISQIIDSWPADLALTSELLNVYPLPLKGIYAFEFDSISLVLIFMKLDQALDEFEPKGSTFFDCLFLDGFAPAKNRDMWHPASLRRLSYLCKQGSTFSTFTAASMVRRCLVHCGFSVTRQKGYGRKRQMLSGAMDREHYRPYKPRSPWYHYPRIDCQSGMPAVIIGGGVAGCATAHALGRTGIKSLIIEKSDKLGGTAGEFKRSLYSPLLSADFNIGSRFYWHACHHLLQYLQTTRNTMHENCGIFFVADSSSRKKYLSAAYRLLRYCGEAFEWLNENETQEHTGISANYPGLLTRYGGWVDVPEFCDELANNSLIQLKNDTTVISLTCKNNTWLVDTDAGPIKANRVILCTGSDDTLISRYQLGKFDRFKGQTTALPVVPAINTLKTVLNNGHYMFPPAANTKEITVGASFEKLSGCNVTPSNCADIENLAAFRHINPALSKTINEHIKTFRMRKRSNSDCGMRLASRDHLPVIGAVPDMDFYENNYPHFFQSGRLKGCPDAHFIPGLYVNTAHGSRGVTASILSGKLICALITGECRPLPRTLQEAVHPARFFVRDQLSGNKVQHYVAKPNSV